MRATMKYNLKMCVLDIVKINVFVFVHDQTLYLD
jgi:hypothetical protein